MSKIFIQNPTGQNVGVQIVSNSDLQLINNGPDGAVVSEGNVVKICLSPDTENTDLPFNEGIINLDGEFVVQVNNEIIPYSFTANQLPHFFNGTRPECRGILFGKRSEEPVIIPAANEMYFVTTTGTFDFYGAAGDVITLSDGTTINITTDLTANIAVPTGKHKVTLTEVREDNYVGIGGEALTELVNFPTSSFITAIDFCPSEGNSVNLVKVPSILPSNISNTSFMFARCNSFNQDISMWDTSHVITMNNMFENATAFNQDISSWNTSHVINMVSMFNGASAFNQNLSQWCVPFITKDPADFATDATLFTSDKFPVWGTCPRGENLPAPVALTFKVGSPDNDTFMVINDWNFDAGTTVEINWGDGSPVETFNETTITNLYHDFVTGTDAICTFKANKKLPMLWLTSDAVTEIVDFGNFGITNPKFSFDALVKVPSVLPTFITDMTEMFYQCRAFNDPSVVNWDTLHVTKMGGAFTRSLNFNQPIGNWDVSYVTEMWSMFAYCDNFNQPLNTWNVGNVTGMNQMFYEAFAFNQDIGNWNTSIVTNMGMMFYRATAFNQDLSQWCVGQFPSLPDRFSSFSALQPDKHPVWGTCPRGENQV